MSDKPSYDTSRDNDLRWFAARVVAGEFKNLVIILQGEDGIVQTYGCGELGAYTRIGMVEVARQDLIDHLRKQE